MEKLNSPIILVFYVNVGNLDNDDVQNFMKDVQKRVDISLKDERRNLFQRIVSYFIPSTLFMQYFIPIRSGETRVECINSKIVGKETFQKTKNLLDRMNNALEGAVKSQNMFQGLLDMLDVLEQQKGKDIKSA